MKLQDEKYYGRSSLWINGTGKKTKTVACVWSCTGYKTVRTTSQVTSCSATEEHWIRDFRGFSSC